MPQNHRLAGKGISAHYVRPLTGDVVLEAPEIYQGESRGDLAVGPLFGVCEGYRTSFDPFRGLGRRN